MRSDEPNGPLAAGPAMLLASASPRRGQLVHLLGLPVRTTDPAVDEERYACPDVELSALSIARAKAAAAAPALSDGEVLLAADTVVALDGRSLGKPADAGSARAMLSALSGRPHVVATGVALQRWDGLSWGAVVATRVFVRRLSPQEIDRYVARGEPFDKAGGYAIQDSDLRPVERWTGCYLNVVGLPLCAVRRGLEALGSASPESSEPLVPPCVYCERGAALVSIEPG